MSSTQVKLRNGFVVNVRYLAQEIGGKTKITIFHNGFQYSHRDSNPRKALNTAIDKLKMGIS
jgi:hypothetical protein